MISGRPLPFVGQLKAVTGAGKTPVLADVIGRLRPGIVLWTTKFGSVVDQTATNLSTGGKYNHLLGPSPLEVLKFGDIPSAVVWRRILSQESGLTVLVSTVAAWFSNEKDERLNVHRVNPDWGDRSRWDQLRGERRRPLWVVYDEAHNTTQEQVDLLDELLPAGFLIASASPVKGKLNQYLTLLSEEERKSRFVSIPTRAVVDAQLLKSTIALADYDSPDEAMIVDVANRREALEAQLRKCGEGFSPKAIYVVEASNTTKSVESRPVFIWNTLTKKARETAQSVAVCTNTKELPKGAIRVKTIDELSEDLIHIIFNKKLQEGWDDPTVYVCYLDGETSSATRIQQVIGRALRQPGGSHFADEDLNTAYFYVKAPTDALERIVDELKEELRIYRDDDDPDDFEPFQVKNERKAIPKAAVREMYDGNLTIPRLQLELPSPEVLAKGLARHTYGFSEEDRAAAGRALVNIVSVRTGEVDEQEIDLFESTRVSCGTFLQQQIRALSKNCLNAMNPALFVNAKLQQTACYKSKALEHYKQVAQDTVSEYENHVHFTRLEDPDQELYVLGPYQPSGSVKKEFEHAAHPYYDSKSFNNDELDFARALDNSGYVWARNKDRLDYGIPLPVKSGTSSQFFPDFVWWVKEVVWLLDTTGKFILDDKVRTKLLTTPAPIRIGLVVRGKLNPSLKPVSSDGWSVLRFRLGNAGPESFDELADALSALIEES